MIVGGRGSIKLTQLSVALLFLLEGLLFETALQEGSALRILCCIKVADRWQQHSK